MGNNQTMELQEQLNEKTQQFDSCQRKWNHREWIQPVIGHPTRLVDNTQDLHVYTRTHDGVVRTKMTSKDQTIVMYPNKMAEVHAAGGQYIHAIVEHRDGDYVHNFGIVDSDSDQIYENIKWLIPQTVVIPAKQLTWHQPPKGYIDYITYRLLQVHGFKRLGQDPQDDAQTVNFSGKKLTGVRAVVGPHSIVNIQFEVTDVVA